MGRLPLSEAERYRREQMIIRSRAEDLSLEKTAKVLDLSVGVVSTHVRSLVDRGLLAPKKRGRKKTYLNLKSKRVRAVIKLKKQSTTLGGIGEAMGFTWQRAQQLIQAIATQHGETVLIPRKKVWTIPEAARELDVNRWIIDFLCEKGEVPYHFRNGTQRNSRLLTQRSMKILREHPEVTGKRRCIVCKKPFGFVKKKGRRKLTCENEQCRRDHKRMLREETLLQKPSADSLSGWHLDLYKKLQLHKPPLDEKWLTLKNAVAFSRLSRMQVEWLRLKDVITTSKSLTQKWHGRPVLLYAASELEFAKQAYEAYQQSGR